MRELGRVGKFTLLLKKKGGSGNRTVGGAYWIRDLIREPFQL